MHRDWLLFLKSFMKILALQHLRNRVLRRQTNKIFGGEFGKPATVEIDDCFLSVENLEYLRLVRFGILRDLFSRQRRTSRRASRRIADHSCEVADQENDRMPEILEMFELAQENGVSQMKIRCSRIESRLYPQRLAGLERALQFRAQLGF